MPPFRFDSLLPRAGLALLAVWMVVECANLDPMTAHGDAPGSRVLAIAGIVALSALASSIVGFAFCAIAGSAFAYLGVDPVQAVQTMVICSTAIQLYAVWKIRASIRWLWGALRCNS